MVEREVEAGERRRRRRREGQREKSRGEEGRGEKERGRDAGWLSGCERVEGTFRKGGRQVS